MLDAIKKFEDGDQIDEIISGSPYGSAIVDELKEHRALFVTKDGVMIHDDEARMITADYKHLLQECEREEYDRDLRILKDYHAMKAANRANLLSAISIIIALFAAVCSILK